MTALSRTNRRGATPLVGQRNPGGAKARTCPKCEAKPGHSCRRWIAADTRWGGGEYWKTLSTFHRER